jgi:hypothetical protein
MGPSRWVISGRAERLGWWVAYSHRPRLAPSGSQDESPVSQPAPAVGRFNSAHQDAAYGPEQARRLPLCSPIASVGGL